MAIKCFSKETCREIGNYVYRLIDPRDGTTFYVGRGVNNRVFAHVNSALENYSGENYLGKDEEIESLKLKRIRQIKDAGLDVVHVIQRWGMDLDEAKLVESTLIDVYGLNQLTNRIGGYDQDHGVINAETLEARFHCDFFEETDALPPFVIIKVQYWRLDELSNTGDARYEATRFCWKIAKWRTSANRYPYVLSVTDGIVREVYEVESWYLVEDGRGRYAFIGHVAKEDVRSLFYNKRIPLRFMKKGLASPVLFSK